VGARSRAKCLQPSEIHCCRANRIRSKQRKPSRASALPQCEPERACDKPGCVNPSAQSHRPASMTRDKCRRGIAQSPIVKRRRHRKISHLDSFARIELEHTPSIILANDVKHEAVVDVEFHGVRLPRNPMSVVGNVGCNLIAPRIATNQYGSKKCASRESVTMVRWKGALRIKQRCPNNKAVQGIARKGAYTCR
jgi:hypothetical protein